MASWFLGSWFLGFLISWLLVSWFQSFKDLPNSISGLLIDIDPIFEILLDRAAEYFGARLFGNCQNTGFAFFEIYTNNISTMFQGCFLNLFRYPGVSNDKNSWFWGSGTRPEIPKSLT